ncbi:MAG TPA: DUF2752 domain-containing protein [Longimicrobium sp.]|nr:DUF2752 domain-containing protein [Longimicrobium sp.]
MRLAAAVTRPYWFLAAATLAAAPAAAVLYLYNPMRVNFYPRCVLFVVTGIYCPGCGVLRASHALLHGHVFTALGFNALFVVMLPFLLYAVAAQVLQAAYGRPVLPTRSLTGRQARLVLYVFVAFTLVRNIPLYPFNLLAP